MSEQDRIIQRFLAKVQKTPSCWIWTANYLRTGYPYGLFKIRGVMRTAHRVSYELFVGAIPDGMCVLHNCPEGDNPRCVNPAHLWVGTRTDNNRDTSAKGRARGGNLSGEQNGFAKLTWGEVRTIRWLYAMGCFSQSLIGRIFGHDQTLISMIVRRRIWKEPIEFHHSP